MNRKLTSNLWYFSVYDNRDFLESSRICESISKDISQLRGPFSINGWHDVSDNWLGLVKDACICVKNVGRDIVEF